jgi:hypothetical protein
VLQGVVIHLTPRFAAPLEVGLGLLVALLAGWVFQEDLAQSQLVHFNCSLLGQHLLELVAIFQLILFLAPVGPELSDVYGRLTMWMVFVNGIEIPGLYITRIRNM